MITSRNHDVFWLQGQYHDSNKKTDTTEVRTEVVDGLKHALLDLKVRGAHVLRIHGMPLIFVHAGFRPAMVRFVQDEYYTRIGGNITTAEQLAKYVNLLVHEVAEKVTTHVTTISNPKYYILSPFALSVSVKNSVHSMVQFLMPGLIEVVRVSEVLYGLTSVF